MTRRTSRAALISVLILTAAFCFTQLTEVDYHWHLVSGRRILDGGGIPTRDDLTYTSSGRPWVDMQWLFELGVAAVERCCGSRGTDLLKVALVVVGFALAIRAALRRGDAPVVAVLALLSVVASQERFSLRPEAASFLLLGLLLDVLETRRTRPRRLVGLPLLMLVWANVHALYAVGLAAIGLTWAGDRIESRLGRGRPTGSEVDDRSSRLGWILAASAAATLVTPYRLSGWVFPVRLLLERIGAGNVYGQSIAEFQAPFGAYGHTTAVAAFAGLVCLLAVAGAFAPSRLRAADLLLGGSMLGLALLARRNLPLFCLAALPAGSAAVSGALHRLLVPGRGGSTRSRGRLEIGMAGAVMALALALGHAVITNRFYAHEAGQRFFGAGEAPGFFPGDLADRVRRRGVPGQVLNDLPAGGFLSSRWYPVRRTFIDGRLEVQDETLYAAYLRLQHDPPFFESVARRYQIDTVLWSHRESAGAARLLRYLAGGHGWRLVDADLAGALFVRQASAAANGGWVGLEPDDPDLRRRIMDQIEESERIAARADPVPRALRRLIPRREIPAAAANAGIFFAIVGGNSTSEALFRRALLSSEAALLHYDLGLLLQNEGRLDEARASFEAALARDPACGRAHGALGLLSLRNNEAEAAMRHWELAEREGSLDPAMLEARGALLARRGRLDDAIEDYRRLLRSDPTNASARLALGRLQAADGDAVGAERSYRLALRDDPGMAEAHLELARLLSAAGRVEEALQESRRAVTAGLDPQRLISEPGLQVLSSDPRFQRLIRDPPRASEESGPGIAIP